MFVTITCKVDNWLYHPDFFAAEYACPCLTGVSQPALFASVYFLYNISTTTAHQYSNESRVGGNMDGGRYREWSGVEKGNEQTPEHLIGCVSTLHIPYMTPYHIRLAMIFYLGLPINMCMQ